MAKSVKPSWIVTHHGRNIHIVKETAPQLKNWERWILVLSDVHFDGDCDRPVLKRLLQVAVKRDAMIISNGDWYDLCQGRTDARQDKARLRSNLAATAYFDECIDETASFLCDEVPGAAERWVFFGAGNHETSWTRHHETCPVSHTVRALKSKCKTTQVGAGGYGGWMKVQLEAGGNHLTFTMKYFHGAGGGFSAAKNMFSWIESCDAIVCGHDHNSNIIGVQREYLSSQNGAYRVHNRFCSFIRVGTLAKGYKDGAQGYEAQLGSGPKPCRQKWIRLFVDYELQKATTSNRSVMRPRMNWEVLDAQ